MYVGMIGVVSAWESDGRLLHPVSNAFDEAIPVAVLGLGVNLASAWLLRDDRDHHGHGHQHASHHDEHDHDEHDHDEHDHVGHGHDDDHHHAARATDHHRDLNLRAAYVHVLADAAVSILAIVGLLAGRELGWIWMDPVMGIVGACVIANWSWGLVRAAGATLLDLLPDETLAGKMRARLESGDDRVADLHLWRIGPGHCAAVVSIVSDAPASPAAHKARPPDFPRFRHSSL